MKDRSRFLHFEAKVPVPQYHHQGGSLPMIVSAISIFIYLITFYVSGSHFSVGTGITGFGLICMLSMSILVNYQSINHLAYWLPGIKPEGKVKAPYQAHALARRLLQPQAQTELELHIKRLTDVVVALISITLLLPLMAYISLRVWLSSKGPIFFTQERIGQGGKPFTMYKFRSMGVHAECNGPALSVENDPRITGYGRIIRKWRLDEIPQLWNVLKGEMTLVGPRPERQFYIDRITEHAPNYARLQQLKPGLTSMGIVNFGYASSVTEMIDRQRHDQYYFENRSLHLDFLIMASTLDVIINRKGK